MQAAGQSAEIARSAMSGAARWMVRAAILISVMAVLTSVAVVWLCLNNPVEVAHVVNEGLAATASRLVSVLAAAVVKAVRLL